MSAPRVFFRSTPLTRLSLPVLLNAWDGVPGAPDIQVVNRAPEQAKKGDVVLYSFLTPQLPDLHPEIKSLLERGILLVAGGPHADGNPALTLETGFHSCITGDGETALPLLARDIIAGNRLSKRYDGGRDSDFSAWMPFSSRLPTLPPLELMRGCRFRCAYCATSLAGRPRFRSFASVQEYFLELKRRDAKRVNFLCPSALEYQDPSLNVSPKETVVRLLTAARSAGFKHIEYGIFPSEIRPDGLDSEWVRILRAFVSNRRVTLGAQSGSSRRLRELRRGHDIPVVEQAVETANSGGFTVNLDVIVGFPDESCDELAATIRFVRRMHRQHRVHIQVHHFFPLPGTPLEHRLPTFHADTEIRLLEHLDHNGLITRQWQAGLRDARSYLEWLRETHPGVYALYH